MFFMPPEPANGRQDHNSLLHLGESIESLLGSKSDLTFTWAESVRLIIDDQYAPPSAPTSPTLSDGAASSDLEELPSSDAELTGELQRLRAALQASSVQRRVTLNRYLDLKGNIRVFCRVRPFLPNERRARTGPLVTPDADKVIVSASGNAVKDFEFDRVFDPVAPQDDVFSEVQPIIQSALDGHNVCIFAYGQTGTGKTFTMEGSKECPGVVPRTLEQLFIEASRERNLNFSYSFSMLEVYMGSLRDLLVPRRTRINDPPPKCLSIQMGPTGFIEVENLTELPVADFQQAKRLYQIGSRARSTSCTNANETSSRSHCLLRISITCDNPDGSKSNSKLWLIDLGGSERLLKTQAKGQTLEEGKSINVSLSALGDVINALQRKQPHIPFRNSKLTQILQDSLGEDSKTIMLVHVSPKQDDLGETVCSLAFGKRAKGVHLGKELSVAAKEEKEAAMAGLLNQIKAYQKTCQKISERIQKVEAKIEENRERKEKEAAAAKLVEEEARMQAAARLKEEVQNELFTRQQAAAAAGEEEGFLETALYEDAVLQVEKEEAMAEEQLQQVEAPKVPPPIKVRVPLAAVTECELATRSVPAARAAVMTPASLPRFMTPTASSMRKHRFGSADDFDALLGGASDKVLKIEEKSATHLKKAFGCKFTDLNLGAANSSVVKLERRHTIEPDRRASAASTLDLSQPRQLQKMGDNTAVKTNGPAAPPRASQRVRFSSDETALRSYHATATEQATYNLSNHKDGAKSVRSSRGPQRLFQAVRPPEHRDLASFPRNDNKKSEKPFSSHCTRASMKGQRRWTLECSTKLTYNRRV